METYNPQDMAEKIMEELTKARKKLTHLNIMVLGKTGVGKSTLINNTFSETLAETGIGKPVTHQIRKYEKEEFPLSIYDTPGLELGGENALDELLKEIVEVITDGIKTGDISKAIHCIWYCVSTTSHRFEEAEKQFINKFLDETNKYNIPVILVLTQSYSKKDAKELKSEIEKENLAIAQIVPVLAEDYEIDEEYTAKAFGLEKLTEVTNNIIPEAVRNTLVAVQKANIQLKKMKAQAIIATSTTAAVATCAVPIPLSDAAMLVPEQIAMLVGITAVFGLPIEKATICSLISATIGTTGTTIAGKSIVSGLLKLIPGVGSLASLAISGSTAASLTAALGEAYTGIMILISNGEMSVSDLNSDDGKKQIAALFKEKLSLKRDTNGKAEE